jgi:hypothetical protein
MRRITFNTNALGQFAGISHASGRLKNISDCSKLLFGNALKLRYLLLSHENRLFLARKISCDGIN